MFGSWEEYKGTLAQLQNSLKMLKANNNEKLKKEMDKLKESMKIELKKVKENHIINFSTIFGILDLKDINLSNIVKDLDNSKLYIDFASVNKDYYLLHPNEQNKSVLMQIDNKLTQIIDDYIKTSISEDREIKIKNINQKILNSWLQYKGSIFEYQNILSMLKDSKQTNLQTKQAIERLKKLTIKLDNNEQNYEKKNYKQHHSQKIHPV